MNNDAASRRGRVPGDDEILNAAVAGPIASHRSLEPTPQASSDRPLYRLADDLDPRYASLAKAFLERAIEIAATLELDPELSRDDRLMRAASLLGARPITGWPSVVAPGTARLAVCTGTSARKANRTTELPRPEAEAAMTLPPLYPHVVLHGEELDGNSVALVTSSQAAMREAGITNLGSTSLPGKPRLRTTNTSSGREAAACESFGSRASR